MMLALVFGWLLLGSTPRVVAVVMGGIGFGLFLDEVGKFVTKDNDYFYGPSAEIMYLLVVLILLISRFVRDLKRPSVPEAIANAAVIAADGVAHGLPESRRRQAADLLDFAEARDADPALVTHIRGLLDASVDTPDRLTRVRARALALIPNFFRRRWWVTLIGWLLVVSSALTVIVGALGLYVNHRDYGIYLELSRDPTAAWILFVSGVVTLACSGVGDDRSPPHRPRLAAARATDGGARLHYGQRPRRLRARRLRSALQPGARSVRAGDHRLSPAGGSRAGEREPRARTATRLAPRTAHAARVEVQPRSVAQRGEKNQDDEGDNDRGHDLPCLGEVFDSQVRQWWPIVVVEKRFADADHACVASVCAGTSVSDSSTVVN